MDITDSELRERLISLGYNPPPITGTSRNVLLKKLKSLETGVKMDTENDSDTITVDDEDQQEFQFTAVNSKPTEIYQRRVQQAEFIPKIERHSNIVEKRVFWNRFGIFGTSLFLIGMTLVIFFVLQFFGDWNDKRSKNLSSFH